MNSSERAQHHACHHSENESPPFAYDSEYFLTGGEGGGREGGSGGVGVGD